MIRQKEPVILEHRDHTPLHVDPGRYEVATPSTESQNLVTTPDSLLAFARGSMSARRAIRSLGLRDYAQLLLALGASGLEPPRLPPEKIGQMQATFVRLLRGAKHDQPLHPRHS
jgi:hypothetical protein